MSITIKQAFEKLTMVCGAALKNPFFVQRNLHDAFADIAANIEGGGGGGSTVTVTQTQSTGNKIGTITVDGTGTDLYAPDPSLSISGHTLNLYKGTSIDIPSSVELPGDTVRVNPIQETGSIIAEITVNNVTSQIKAPSASGLINYSTSEQDTGLTWIDGKKIYQKSYSLGAGPNKTTTTWAHNINNLGMVVELQSMMVGNAQDTSNLQIPLNFCPNASSAADATWIRIDGDNIQMGSGANRAVFDIYATIRYTKTTT